MGIIACAGIAGTGRTSLYCQLTISQSSPSLLKFNLHKATKDSSLGPYTWSGRVLASGVQEWSRSSMAQASHYGGFG